MREIHRAIWIVVGYRFNIALKSSDLAFLSVPCDTPCKYRPDRSRTDVKCHGKNFIFFVQVVVGIDLNCSLYFAFILTIHFILHVDARLVDMFLENT